MLSGCLGVHDMRNAPAGSGERIGDQGAMTTPGQGFGAHDGGIAGASKFLQFGQSRLKCRGCHIIRIAPEGSVSPAGVRRIFPGMAQTSQCRDIAVVNPGSLEFAWELLNPKLRMSA